MQKATSRAILKALLILLFYADLALSEESPFLDSPAEIKGRIDVGGRLIQRFGWFNPFFKGKLSLKSGSYQGFSGKLVAKGDDVDPELRIKEISIAKKFSQHSLRFGLQKKRIGNEYHRAFRQRKTIERTLLYEQLHRFAYAGTETALSYQWQKPSGIFANLKLGMPPSKDNNILITLGHKNEKEHTLQNTLLLEQDQLEKSTQLSGANVVSFWGYLTQRNFLDLEFAIGIDPIQSELNKISSNQKTIIFQALKSTYSYALDDNRQQELILSISQLYKNSQNPSQKTSQLLLGYSLWFHEKTRFMVNFDLRHSKQDKNISATLNDSSYSLQISQYL